MHVVTLITSDYLDRARPLLASLALVTSARRWCVCYGWRAEEGLRAEYPHVEFVTLDRHPSESFGMLQHGRWLDALPPVGDGDLAVLCDGDGYFQRDFSPAELARLAAYDSATFGAVWNAWPGDDLYAEASRIGLRDARTFPGEGACYGCGFLAMRGGLWRRLRDLYESRCAEFYTLTEARSRCQWLICWCLARLGARPDTFAPDVHGQGHFGTPPGVTFRDGRACYHGEPVLFRHAL